MPNRDAPPEDTLTGQYIHLEVKRLDGDIQGIRDRLTSIERIMGGLDTKVDSIQTTLDLRQGNIAGAKGVLVGMFTVLGLIAAWLTGLLPIFHKGP
jgi:hypothetical protein